jgi:SAM-dependent methyltransferase
MPVVEDSVFSKHVAFWRTKSAKGDSYVGRSGEDHLRQKKAVEDLLATRLNPSDFFEDALDFGCGYGRFDPFLSRFCGHIWAVDIVPGLAERAMDSTPTLTGITLESPDRIPFRDRKIDLVWSCLVFQHLTDFGLFSRACSEIRRVCRAGARILIVDNAVDRAFHVTPRGPEILARELGFRPGWQSYRITINSRPLDHWLIDGIKA